MPFVRYYKNGRQRRHFGYQGIPARSYCGVVVLWQINHVGFKSDELTRITWQLKRGKQWQIFYFDLIVSFSSNWLWMYMISSPKTTAPTIKILFNIPSTENETLIRMVEITKPEFRIIVWNLSE